MSTEKKLSDSKGIGGIGERLSKARTDYTIQNFYARAAFVTVKETQKKCPAV